MEKVPISGSRGQSASVYMYVGKLKAHGEMQWKNAITQTKFLIFILSMLDFLKLDLVGGTYKSKLY